MSPEKLEITSEMRKQNVSFLYVVFLIFDHIYFKEILSKQFKLVDKMI